MDALALERAVLAGYDWGGRAACVVAALWPERARFGLGQRLQHPGHCRVGQTSAGGAGAPPLYQYYFHTPRGRAGLEANRREICRLLCAYGRRIGGSSPMT
jgi:pimeloyl-ACP methyl ester carboxylesterase